jgi:PAS domain S-box-containing protein
MSASRPPRPPPRLLAAIALLLLYFLAGKLGLSFAFVNASASAVWPPAGIALAACLLGGRWVAPVIFVGAFLVNITTAGSFATSVAIAAGNTLEAVVGAALITRLAHGRHAFERATDVFKFAILAAVATTTSATVGVTSLALAGFAPWAEYGRVWLTWWLGDTAGVVVVAPIVVLWSAPLARWSGARIAEMMLSLGAVALIGGAVFVTPGLRHEPLPFLCLAPFVWIALRFGVREVATGIGVLTLIATWATARGLGPFAMPSENESLLLLQGFMATMALMILPMAALVDEHRRFATEQEALREVAEGERARMQAAGEVRSRLAAIVEGSDDAILSLTMAGVITSWNGAAEQMFGYSAAEAIGQRITLIIPPDRQAEEEALLAKLGRGERIDPLETIRLTKGGRLLPISLTVSPIRHESGAIVGASKVARDISERVRREATSHFLDETGRLLATSLDYEMTLTTLARLAVPTMGELCAVDMVAVDGSIRRLATAHVDPDKEALADTLIARYPMTPSTKFGVPEVLRTGIAALHRDPPAWLDESALRTEEDRGILRALALRSLIIVPMAARGRMLGALTFATTESGRRYDEEDLVLAQDLARRAAIAVDNARLYKEAQDANRAKDEFLAVLSHELRTPLTSVLGWARMLASGQLDPAKTRQAVETIERNARLQSQLINDLLDVSRIVLGKVQLDLRPVELVPIVEQALEAPARIAAAKGVHLDSHLDAAAGLVLGDPLRLDQIVTNLVGNAVKFTPEGGRVAVRLDRDGGQVKLVVQDTGAGIEATALPYIFDAFRQADSSVSRRHGGLGLGLAIVRNLVELHRGTLTAASEGAGRGTTLTVRFPGVTTTIVSRGGWEAAPDGERSHPSRLDGLRILVVDDDADSRQLLSTILAQRGAEIRAAAGVEDALAIAKDQVIDALVSDIGMPEKSGYDLISAFRAMRPRHQRVPAIAVTALAGRQDHASVLAAGFQVYVVKPIDPETLVSVIARALGRPA